MLRVVPELGPRIPWSRDEPRAGALMSHGGPLGAMIKITHNEKASITRVQIGSRSKNQPIHSGAVTRISGDLSWNRNLENTWDWTAVNALVELTKGNVNTVHTSGKNYIHRKGLVSRKC